MDEKDKVLTLKDWIESFWAFQEEDIRFFKEELKEKLKSPQDLLNDLRSRMQTRRVYHNIFKHLSWRDLPPEELNWAYNKLDEIIARENIINDAINRILDVISELYLEEETGKDNSSKSLDLDKSIIFH